MKPLKTHLSPAYFLDSWQEEQHFELAQKQREAVEQSLQSGLLVITGGPGTGKTTVVQTIISLAEQEQLHIMLCAPTGRAAKRLTETTARDALTIHRLLVPDGYDMNRPVFEYNETNHLKADLIIVDEVSMLDMSLFHSLLLALKPTCRLILVGDADQLPSVGAGSVLHDIIRSQQVPVVRLDTIFVSATAAVSSPMPISSTVAACPLSTSMKSFNSKPLHQKQKVPGSLPICTVKKWHREAIPLPSRSCRLCIAWTVASITSMQPSRKLSTRLRKEKAKCRTERRRTA